MRQTRGTLAVLLGLALVLAGPAGRVHAEGRDPDVERGIRLVEDGDYDGAIFLLDAAARRLAAGQGRIQDLSEAYLHLGIAYLGKGHESAAKAQFRQALTRIRDLTLSSDRFSPKVIDVFEAAKAEVREAAGAAPGRTAPGPAAPAKSGGGGKGLLLAGGGLAVAGGVAVAVGGGGGKGADAAPAGPTTPGTPQTQSFTGNLGGTENLNYPISVGGSGTLEAKLSWENPETLLALDLHLPGSVVATSTRTSRTTTNLTIHVGAQRYTLQLLHRGGCEMAPPPISPHCTTPFTLQVVYP